MGQFDQLQGMGPGVNLAQDPNMPSKKEQMRLIALQTVTQLCLNGAIDLKISEREAGAAIVGHSQAIEKYLNNG